MKKYKDPNYVARVEKAISKKYGYDAIQNPRANWDDEKEEEYKKQLQKMLEKEDRFQEKHEKIEVDGVFVNKKLLTREHNRKCPVCDSYSFSIQDDVYMTKFECCKSCYVRWVEDREERWETGWRPTKEKTKCQQNR
tara:strand:- start:1087 stop:1497 length:411 start_codon:yes stop_codon:yes gene_type:complete